MEASWVSRVDIGTTLRLTRRAQGTIPRPSAPKRSPAIDISAILRRHRIVTCSPILRFLRFFPLTDLGYLPRVWLPC